MILAAARVSSVFAENHQLLLTPRSTPADSGGNYHFEQLPVGFIRLAAAQAGFQQYVREGIQITAGFSAEVNIQMTVGAQNETVTVSAERVPCSTSPHHGFYERKRQNRGRRNPSNPHHAGDVSIAPGVMPTSAPDLGGGVIASFVLSAYGITGQSKALIEGINTRHPEGDYDYIAPGRSADCSHRRQRPDTAFKPSSATWLRSSKTPADRQNHRRLRPAHLAHRDSAAHR